MKFPEQESSTLEFKREIPKNDQIIKTIVGFCNQQGGRLIIGVDNEGMVVGIPEEKAEEMLEHLQQTIYQATHPSIRPLIYAQRLGEKTILIIQVDSGPHKPYHIKNEGPDKGTYIRIGRSTLHATPETIDELRLQSRGIPYEQTPVYQARVTDVDLKRFDGFLTHKDHPVKKLTPEITQEALRAYTVITTEHMHQYPTVAGILLFGKNPQQFLSEAHIICSHFAGIAGRETLATRDCLGTLIEQFDNTFEFVISRLNVSFSIKGVRREDKLEIPREALREMLLNAIVHRNYYIPGPTKIAIYRDRIEIFSPGMFARPISVENLTAGFTYIRNPAIVKVFRELGYIEKLGTGFRILFESYEKAGLRKPQVIEGENFIKCILPRPTPADTDYRALPSMDQKIIDLFARVNELSIADVMEQLHLSRATAGRLLARLVEHNILERIGNAKATRYLKR